MSAETIVRRALRNASQPEHLIDQYTPDALRIINNFVADGHSPEKAEQLLTVLIRQAALSNEPWGEGVAPEPAALTDAVVKRTFMEVAESERRSRPAGKVFGSTDDHMEFLVGALAARLGESDGGERLRNDFRPAIGEAMRDFLLRLESEQAASEPKPEQIVEPEQIAEPQPTAKQAMLSPEDIHKKFSALKKPRRAFALFARDKRPALEERGMSLGEIGTALRPAFLRATTSRLHPPVGLTLGKMWSSLEQDDKEEYEGMEQYDKYRYDTELEFANFSRGGKSMLNFPLSWIYPCTGPRDFFDNCPATWRLDERGDGHRDDYYATVALPEVALTSGKWYYEVTILKVPEALQLGWARSGFSANPEGGCGDDEFSYSCDRVRCLLWHSEEDTPWNACLHGPASEKATDVGDVIGCMLDLDRGEIRFSIDGLVEEEPEFPEISLASGYFPALTMSVGEIEINFGAEGFRCLPEGYSGYSSIPKRLAANEQELAKQLKLRESLAATAEQVKRTHARLNELGNILKNPDRSGALAVLEILDRTDAARGSSEVPPGQRDASESGTSGWRHATVEDYGVAMRAALEELAESDRREIECFRREQCELMAEMERVDREVEREHGVVLPPVIPGPTG